MDSYIQMLKKEKQQCHHIFVFKYIQISNKFIHIQILNKKQMLPNSH